MGSSNDSPIVQMNQDIFGDEYIEYLEKEHMYELLEHKELSVTVISLYIRFLYEKVVCTRKLSNKYSFLSPHKMSMWKLDPENVKNYIVDMFLGNKESDKLFLAPYNSGAHWVLFAINAVSEVIYYLDPVHGDYTNHPGIKTMLDTALKVYRAQRGAKVSKQKSNNITWISIKCPRQTNNIDCGYYILRFMKEIVEKNKTIIPETYFANSSPSYSEEDLMELKEEWCQYVLDMKII
ncbi:probable ubiquitin-like-specific protease 2B [Cicer arietinum]